MVIVNKTFVEKLVALADQLDRLGYVEESLALDELLYRDMDPIGVKDFNNEQMDYYVDLIDHGVPKGQAYQFVLQKYPPYAVLAKRIASRKKQLKELIDIRKNNVTCNTNNR